MNQSHSLDLFADAPERPGALGCRVEIAATMADALRAAAARGLDRDAVAERMAFHLGDKFNPATVGEVLVMEFRKSAVFPESLDRWGFAAGTYFFTAARNGRF